MSKKIKIGCPKCKRTLQVPTEAAGRHVRCPGCTHVFPVPEQREKPPSDDSIAGWIFNDVGDEIDDKLEGVDQKIQQYKPSITKVDRGARTKQTEQQLSNLLGGDALPMPPTKAAAPAAPAPAAAAPEPAAAPTSGRPPATSAAVAPAPAPAPTAVPAAVAAAMAAAAAAASSAASDPTVNAQGYPAQILTSAPLPRLIVRECSHHGVVLAFDSSWLEHPGFRTSLPLRCIFSNNPDRSDLYVRPLLFADRSQGQIRSSHDVQSGHGQRLFEGVSAKELLQLLPVIDKLPQPFNVPMPHYVSSSYAERELVCRTQGRPDGCFTCEVVVPDPRYALDWLARVNGICGPEYELLENDVKLLQSDIWGQMPGKTRERLESWVKFLPRERFKLYLNDAEFGQKDAGLAGLVVTDKRLLYRKYHRGGEILLADDATLLIRAEGEFAAVTLQTSDNRTRLGSLRLEDVPRLLQNLGHATGMKIDHNPNA